MCDLGLKNFDVFMSAFPQQNYDLVIMDRESKNLKKVEVKTGYRSETGKIHAPNHAHNGWDIMAVVIRNNNEIYYHDNKGNELFNNQGN